MHQQLPFFNFSLKKVLAAEPDSFTRAKLKIIITALLFALLKSLIVCFFAIEFHQSQQLARSAAGFFFILIFVKVLFYRPSSLLLVANIIVLMELGVIWSNIFFLPTTLTL